MQKHTLKKIGFFSFFSLIIVFGALAQEKKFQNSLNEADSLFNPKRFTQSFEVYNQLYAQNVSSPAMLIKMAYISEALHRKAQTLYFLNAYYLQTGNDMALRKMEDLAVEWNLPGYETSGADFLDRLFIRYSSIITSAATAFSVLALFLLVLLKKKTSLSLYLPAVLFVLLVFAALGAVNYESGSNKAIVFAENVPAFAGPSPGSKLLTRIPEGQRFQILESNDIWTAIQWEGQKAYIRNIYLKHLLL